MTSLTDKAGPYLVSETCYSSLDTRRICHDYAPLNHLLRKPMSREIIGHIQKRGISVSDKVVGRKDSRENSGPHCRGAGEREKIEALFDI